MKQPHLNPSKTNLLAVLFNFNFRLLSCFGGTANFQQNQQQRKLPLCFGYVTQDHSERTIEAELFKALTKTCLIPPLQQQKSREETSS